MSIPRPEMAPATRAALIGSYVSYISQRTGYTPGQVLGAFLRDTGQDPSDYTAAKMLHRYLGEVCTRWDQHRIDMIGAGGVPDEAEPVARFA